MTRHIDEGLLHDLAEGLLDPGQEADVRGHLEVCAECRHTFDGIQDLVSSLAHLPQEAEPSRDLWPQIAWRMEGSEKQRDEKVQTVSASNERRIRQSRAPARARRFSLSAWQLAAASIALILISGVSVWAILSGRVDGPAGPAMEAGPAQFASWEEAYGGYDEAVADLESFLEQGRELLDPQTVEVLEENLRTIDAAILESREALAQDPASDILQRFLALNLRKKVDLLRQAAGAVYSIT
jgi:hypothetical protein